MNTVVPWADLAALIEPYYPKVTSVGGRPPVGLERMLRIHCLQLWFDLSDPAVEEALYDSRAMRAFVGIDLGQEPVPDESPVMRFRPLLEHNGLGEKIFEEVGRVLLSRGLKVVHDIKEAMKKVAEAGGQVLGEPMEIAGYGLYVSCFDTERNRVSMMQPSSEWLPG